MGVPVYLRHKNNEYIEKTDEDYKIFDSFIEEIKLLSSNHKRLLEDMIFNPT